jgi:hypothetical protein
LLLESPAWAEAAFCSSAGGRAKRIGSGLLPPPSLPSSEGVGEKILILIFIYSQAIKNGLYNIYILLGDYIGRYAFI